MNPFKNCPKCGTSTHINSAKCAKCSRVFNTTFPQAQPTYTPPVQNVPLSHQTLPYIIGACIIGFFTICFAVAHPSAPGVDSGYNQLTGHIYTGTRVYRSNSHDLLFQIMGGSDNHTFYDGTHGRGLKVIYTDGSVGWENRDDALHDQTLLVKNGDPAEQQGRWVDYEF